MWLRSLFYKPKVRYEQTVTSFGLRNKNYPIFVTGEGSSAEAKALEFWNKKFPGMFEASYAGDIYIHYSDNEVAEGKDGRALWSEVPALIYIRPRTRDSWPLIAHELGHCLGLQHTKNPSSIMYPMTYSHQKITEEIISVLRK